MSINNNYAEHTLSNMHSEEYVLYSPTYKVESWDVQNKDLNAAITR